MEHVVFDGIDLSEHFICLVKDRPMPDYKPRTEHVDGSDCYKLRGAEILPEPIVVKLVAPHAPSRRRRELARWLGSVLYSKEPKVLKLSSDYGLWHTATLAKGPKFEELITSGSVEVAFQPMESWMYGDRRSVTVPSGGSVTFIVKGSYPIAPTIHAQSANVSSSTVWGLRLDETDFIHVVLSGASEVNIDCENRTCTVGNNVKLPTLDSDWIQLTSGQHTLRNDQGTGASVVTWTERWL